MVTISDISRQFGVSPMTVSNALNNRKGVSADKAAAIRDYAQRMGYRPAYMARSLLRGKTDMIGLCLRDTPEDPWLAGLIHRIQEGLHQAGYHLNLIIAHDGLEHQRWAIDRFKEFRVDAAIVGPLGFRQQYDALAERLAGLPCALAFDAIEPLPIDHVKLDTHAGAKLAVDHLVSRGHRTIGLLNTNSNERDRPLLPTRHTGFIEAMARHGLEVRQEWILCLADPYADPEQPLREFLASGRPQPSAWFCHNDWHAAHAVRVLQEFDLNVPRDVSIVGFDNQPVAELILPGITSIGFDVAVYARRIVEMVVAGVARTRDGGRDRQGAVRQFQLAPYLIERHSVADLKAAEA
ncbi:MAG: LacI family transcriptional regulator [Phycisphaerae bacterium]|nr:LacI family transcriptional regulator [Phycisphaerae bacterium]